MGKKEKELCPHCGAPMVEYTFTFNKALAVFLAKLYQANKPVRTDSLNLTYSQRTNSQKLRYWGLAEPHINDETKHKRGWWVITQAGIDFVEGRTVIAKQVTMYRNEVVDYSQESVSFDKVSEGYKHHEDYANERKPRVDVL